MLLSFSIHTGQDLEEIDEKQIKKQTKMIYKQTLNVVTKLRRKTNLFMVPIKREKCQLS